MIEDDEVMPVIGCGNLIMRFATLAAIFHSCIFVKFSWQFIPSSEAMSNKMFQRKLKALEFPIWNKFNINNMEHIKTLVVYLEQTKIRELTVSQRTNLKKTKDKNWVRYFGDYLDEIEDCPYQIKKDMQTKDWIEVIEWYTLTLSLYSSYYHHVQLYFAQVNLSGNCQNIQRWQGRLQSSSANSQS